MIEFGQLEIQIIDDLIPDPYSPKLNLNLQLFLIKILILHQTRMDTSGFNFDEAEQMYDVIPALRALAIRDKQPENWKLFWNLMSHLDNWMKDPEWRVSHQYIIDFILDKLKVLQTEEYKGNVVSI